jgi:hypothetical protein
MAAYSIGLGVPFPGVGTGLRPGQRRFQWVKRHYTGITLASSATLGAFGVVLALNRMVWLTSQFRNALAAVGLGRLIRIG